MLSRELNNPKSFPMPFWSSNWFPHPNLQSATKHPQAKQDKKRKFILAMLTIRAILDFSGEKSIKQNLKKNEREWKAERK